MWPATFTRISNESYSGTEEEIPMNWSGRGSAIYLRQDAQSIVIRTERYNAQVLSTRP